MSTPTTVRLVLDDLRPAPTGWVHARSVAEASGVMSAHEHVVVEASLDHDLGDFAHDGGDGYRLVDWMAERDTWPTEAIAAHSGNPVGVDRMLGTVDRYRPYVPSRGRCRETGEKR